MYYFLQRPQIVKNVNCAINLSQLRTTYCLPTQTIMLEENKSNHYHSAFNFNTVVLNPYSNNTAFNPQSFTHLSLSYVPGMFNRTISVWYSNTLWPSKKQCYLAVFKQQLNKFVVNSQYIRFTTPFLFQFIKNGSTAM